METEEAKAASTDTQMVSAKGAMKKAGVFFFLLMILEIPMAILVQIVQSKFSVNTGTLVSLLITQGYLLFGALIYILITKTHFGVDLRMKKYRISTFFLSLVTLVTAWPMANWLNAFSQLFVTNQTSSAIYTVTEQVPMWLGILIIGCLPGFVEETLYRGILFHAFRKRSVLTGIVISAVSFGVMHMNFNQMLYAIYLGVFFALMVEATGSLFSTMILHMLFNAANTVYMYLLPRLLEWLSAFSSEYAGMDMETVLNQTPTTQQVLASLAMLTPFAIGGIVLTILLLRLIADINKRPFTWAYIRGDKEEVSKTKPVNVCLLIGWAFCLLNAVMSMLAD